MSRYKGQAYNHIPDWKFCNIHLEDYFGKRCDRCVEAENTLKRKLRRQEQRRTGLKTMTPNNLETVVKELGKEIFCWKCNKEGIKVGMPLYKVKNSFVFACLKHKDLPVEEDAYSI